MRLICPSCGAQYEVDESVIPDSGRDVQCSNCGHAWFQRSARQLTAAAEEEARQKDTKTAPPPPVAEAEPAEQAEPEQPEAAEPEAAEPEPEGPAAEEPEAAEAAQPKAPAEAESAAEEPAAEAAEPEPAEPEEAAEETAEDGAEPEEEPAEPEAELAAVQSPERVRRTLDDAVKNVLREEAERETRARQVEGSTLESQPDLGLAMTAAPAAAAEPDRVVRVRGDENDLDDDALVSRASRRELLPDIEEINSTLRATSEREGEPAAIDAPETLARRRSGFRMGFSTAVLIAVLLFGLYLLAPLIAASVPAAEPVLTGYVAGVDAARSWLDGQMKSLTQSLQGGGNGG